MAGNGSNGSKKDEYDDIPHERKDPRPDFSTPPPRKKLPKNIQATLDNDETMWEIMYEGEAQDTTDTSLRYAAYASRLRTIMMSAHRYVAYTSDIGESFRPVAHPYWVRGAYAVSWLYLAGDVAHEGYKAYIKNQRVLHPELYTEHDTPTKEEAGKKAIEAVQNMAKGLTGNEKSGVSGTPLTGGEIVPGRVSAIEDYRTVIAQRALFQGVASMGLPAFTIHSIVRYSGRAMKDMKNKTLRTWGPIGLGLVVVPFLPFIFDEPVEHATEWIFYNSYKAVGGEKAVEGKAPMGNHHRPGDVSKEKKEL